jgi:thiamine biosynthesis lipoprotein
MAVERRFRAMGSDAHVLVVGGGAHLIELARERIEALEQRWSRFREDSEITRLNREAGSFVPVSPDTVLLVERAIEAWQLTGGNFDPTVLGAMVRAGYVRSFELLDREVTPGRSELGLGAEQLTIDGDRVRLPAGTGFDPGGIGKGLAADLVCRELLAAGAAGACVNLGGDVRVAGSSPTGDGWTVAVEHPWSATPLALVGLADGAVATSTTLKRRWRSGSQVRHHLIDPQTGQPSESDVALATVIAGDAWLAEVLAKAVLLAGSAHPFDLIEGTGVEGLIVDGKGRAAATSGLGRYLGGAPVPERAVGWDSSADLSFVPASELTIVT